QLQLLNKHAVALAKVAVLIVTAHAQVLDALRPAEAVHREWQVETDRDGVDLATKCRKLIVEFFRLRLANGRIERGHNADEARLSLEIGQLDRFQAALEVVQGEIGSLLADLEGFACKGERGAFKGDSAGTRHGYFLVCEDTNLCEFWPNSSRSIVP